MRKRVGVLIGDADSPFSKSLLDGILQEAKKLNMDVFVFTNFNNNANERLNKHLKKHNRGEQTIYEIINYNKLDAILFVPNSIRFIEVLEQLEEKLCHEFKGPVISVDSKYKNFPSVMYDDIKCMKCMIYHLIDKHGFSSIAFVTGPKTHEHAGNRLKAYLEVLEERGIPVDESLIFYKDFWYDDGEKVVQELLHREKLPQAIACANQHMAISIYDACIKKGIRIPEDIVVTGYDAYDDLVKDNNKITSILRSGEETGKRAIRNLYEKIYNIKLPYEKEIQPKLLLRESCGCKTNYDEKTDYSYHSRRGIINRHAYNSFYSNYNFMMEDIIATNSPEECFENCSYYLQYLGNYDDFYICLNEDWLTRNDTESIYSDTILVALEDHHSNAGTSQRTNKFSKIMMFPDIDAERENTMVYFFTPLHFYGITLGYAVIAFEDKPSMFSECYCTWMHILSTSLQAQRQEHALHEMYEEVKHYAERDLLTGIFSRNGFELYAESMYEQAKIDNQNFIYIIGDINNLKAINNYYGHIWGDKALRILADALENQINIKKINGKTFRIGGDEFVLLLAGDFTPIHVKQLTDKIEAYVEMAKEVYDLPINITVSLGGCLALSTDQRLFREIMEEADQQMYKQKYIYRNRYKNKEITRIWNKIYFEEEVNKRFKENPSQKYALICIQIQNYELYLNVYGRQKSNKIDKILGEIIDIYLLKDSIATKYSDKQYVILYPYQKIKDIENWILKFNINVDEYEVKFKSDYSMKINSGIYLCNSDQGKYSLQEMIERAAFALHVSMDSTKHFIIYDEKMRDKFIEESEITQYIDEAIENNEFQIYLQPQHYLQMNDQVLSAEALARWVKQDGSIISPGAFIPAFEKNGLIAKLDRHIMELTCSFISTHIREAWCRGIRIAVNVSKIDLQHEDFLEYYINIKNKYNIPDRVIEIEFTESAVFEDYDIFKNIMKRLQKNGFVCTLDDFGAGSSSLNLLKELPVDVIKMDRLFFNKKESNDQQRDNSVISSVVGMAKGLGMKIVAEGIEDGRQVEFLRNIGCDVVQGFIFSKPLPLDQFIDYVTRHVSNC